MALYGLKLLQRINFSNANLTNARFFLDFYGTSIVSTLTHTRFNGAIVQGTDFAHATSAGLTESQLDSTASFASRDLMGIGLEDNDLTAWSFAKQNLTGAQFYGSRMGKVRFSGANLTNAAFFLNDGYYVYFSLLANARFANANLGHANLEAAYLAGAEFINAKLGGANLLYATLSGANFRGATIRGADLGFTTSRGFMAGQLYSTASYGANDLTGVGLEYNALSGWNFANQNLANADFEHATLARTVFANAKLGGAGPFLRGHERC